MAGVASLIGHMGNTLLYSDGSQITVPTGTQLDPLGTDPAAVAATENAPIQPQDADPLAPLKQAVAARLGGGGGVAPSFRTTIAPPAANSGGWGGGYS
jgi:hypothetical protein